MASLAVTLEAVPVTKPDDMNVVIGQAHFIKTVEDLHETLAGVSPQLKFGLAFCEASAARLVRRSGNDAELTDLASANAVAIGVHRRPRRKIGLPPAPHDRSFSANLRHPASLRITGQVQEMLGDLPRSEYPLRPSGRTPGRFSRLTPTTTGTSMAPGLIPGWSRRPGSVAR